MQKQNDSMKNIAEQGGGSLPCLLKKVKQPLFAGGSCLAAVECKEMFAYDA